MKGIEPRNIDMPSNIYAHLPRQLSCQKQQKARGRGQNKKAPRTGLPVSNFEDDLPPDYRPSLGSAPPGHDELKALVDGYKGFGILTLIRVLMFRSFRFFLLSLVGIVLLIGQWTGPVGFIAFKVTTDDLTLCPG